MKSRLALLLAFSTLLTAHRIGAAPYDTPECRRAFLVGMSSGSGLIVGDAGLEGFWPTETRAAELYISVAKLYARDIGVDPKKFETGEWKILVAQSLRTKKEESPSVAFLAGAYARWGTPTGFRLSGSGKAYEIAKGISDLNEFTVQLVHQTGYPGGTTITVSDGEETPCAEFFALMRQVEEEVKREPNKSSQNNAGKVSLQDAASGARRV
jgi:hypothetical protein